MISQACPLLLYKPLTQLPRPWSQAFKWTVLPWGGGGIYMLPLFQSHYKESSNFFLQNLATLWRNEILPVHCLIALIWQETTDCCCTQSFLPMIIPVSGHCWRYSSCQNSPKGLMSQLWLQAWVINLVFTTFMKCSFIASHRELNNIHEVYGTLVLVKSMPMPCWLHQLLLGHHSYAILDMVRTWMGHSLGTPHAVGI